MLILISKKREKPRRALSIGINEKISFILDRSTVKDVEEAQRIEEVIEECVVDALEDMEPPVQTVSAESFRKAAFPDLDYLSVPSSSKSILKLLEAPEFKNQINLLGLRYLLVIHGESNLSSPTGFCIGLICVVLWGKTTQMSVSMLDLTMIRNAGEVKVNARAPGWFAIVGIFPIGFPAISEGPACEETGKQVATFIAGNGPKQ